MQIKFAAPTFVPIAQTNILFNWHTMNLISALASAFLLLVLFPGCIEGFSRVGTRPRFRSFTVCADLLQSVQLPKFLELVANKPSSAEKIVLWPSTPVDLDLATRLVGAGFGYEGERIFPSVLSENYGWHATSELIATIENAIRQELARGDGAGLIFE